jgi:hypothetical protein
MARRTYLLGPGPTPPPSHPTPRGRPPLGGGMAYWHPCLLASCMSDTTPSHGGMSMHSTYLLISSHHDILQHVAIRCSCRHVRTYVQHRTRIRTRETQVAIFFSFFSRALYIQPQARGLFS